QKMSPYIIWEVALPPRLWNSDHGFPVESVFDAFSRTHNASADESMRSSHARSAAAVVDSVGRARTGPGASGVRRAGTRASLAAAPSQIVRRSAGDKTAPLAARAALRSHRTSPSSQTNGRWQ